MKLYKMGRSHQMDGKHRGYVIRQKKNGKFFVRAYRSGGQEVRLPFKEFENLEAAAAFAEKQEAKSREYAELNRSAAIKF